MAINPETEIAGSAYANGVHSYTIERGGRRWTIQVTDDELAKFGQPIGPQGTNARGQRRNYVAGRLHTAMMGPPDA
jgi:hypothetical protein